MIAPSSRVRPGLIVAIAIAIAALMFLGIVGLLAVAVFGGDDTPPNTDVPVGTCNVPPSGEDPCQSAIRGSSVSDADTRFPQMGVLAAGRLGSVSTTWLG